MNTRAHCLAVLMERIPHTSRSSSCSCARFSGLCNALRRNRSGPSITPVSHGHASMLCINAPALISVGGRVPLLEGDADERAREELEVFGALDAVREGREDVTDGVRATAPSRPCRRGCPLPPCTPMPFLPLYTTNCVPSRSRPRAWACAMMPTCGDSYVQSAPRPSISLTSREILDSGTRAKSFQVVRPSTMAAFDHLSIISSRRLLAASALALAASSSASFWRERSRNRHSREHATSSAFLPSMLILRMSAPPVMSFSTQRTLACMAATKRGV
mmetsp:Transcript_33848/g.83164  ORF Transcript_33848/g.83164 Transcript_33848/m.83164 type:complete len:275 (-) Transcript_33848:314-1138(-)